MEEAEEERDARGEAGGEDEGVEDEEEEEAVLPNMCENGMMGCEKE